MTLLEELKIRGFIKDIANEHILKKYLQENKKLTVYAGFDLTAPSLHIGHLMTIMMLRIFEKYGHNIIVLLGGGTTKIGDPSGKDKTRQILSYKQIKQNQKGIESNLTGFINFKKNIKILNNDKWISKINYVEFLRDIGKHFTINRMNTMDSVKMRLQREQPLSFTEFNYMLIQSYDFLHLYKKHKCNMQIGGSDQWGNITEGIELINRVNLEEGKEKDTIFGITCPLIETSDGKKMGKSENGAIWLSNKLLSDFDYFQYFRNVSDDDTIKFLYLFTDISIKKLNDLIERNTNINQLKKILAFETTKLCRGEKIAFECLEKGISLFEKRENNMIDEIVVTSAYSNIIEFLTYTCDFIKSKSIAKTYISQGAIKINTQPISTFNITLKTGDIVQIGKKTFKKVIIK